MQATPPASSGPAHLPRMFPYLQYHAPGGLLLMSDNGEPQNLEQLLDRIGDAARDRNQVNIDMILDEVGRRSFGPILLFAGLITLAPIIGDIPGVPTVMALLVLLVGVQVLVRQEHVWLPGWLLRRSVEQGKLKKVLDWSRKPARFIDRFLRPRMTALTHDGGSLLIAVLCVLIAVVMPLTEVVPFSANGVGAILTAFGLALIARDGLMALLALTIMAATIGLVLYYLL